MFTNPWNPTSPADTDAAVSLYDQIRDLKIDVQERLGAFGAGAFADRETPDSADGANFTGVRYWADDTHQVFRWSGSSWVDISNVVPAGKYPIDLTAVQPITVTTVSTDGHVLTIPAHNLLSNDVVRVRAHATLNSGSTGSGWDLLFGGISIGGITRGILGTPVKSTIDRDVAILDAANARPSGIQATETPLGHGIGTFFQQLFSISTGSDIIVKTRTKSQSSVNVTFDYLRVTIYKQG
jgi:hypothetical protein